MIIEPTVAAMFARDGLEDGHGLTEDELAFVLRVRDSRHLYIVLHSEEPRHYTMAEVHKEGEGPEGMTIEFRDSLPHPPASPPAMVEKILRNRELEVPSEMQRGFPARRLVVWPLGHEIHRAAAERTTRRGSIATHEPQGHGQPSQRVYWETQAGSSEE